MSTGGSHERVQRTSHHFASHSSNNRVSHSSKRLVGGAGRPRPLTAIPPETFALAIHAWCAIGCGFIYNRDRDLDPGRIWRAGRLLSPLPRRIKGTMPTDYVKQSAVMLRDRSFALFIYDSVCGRRRKTLIYYQLIESDSFASVCHTRDAFCPASFPNAGAALF